MIGFYYEHSSLVCDGVPLAMLAGREGTPLYVYSARTIRERYQTIAAAFESYPHGIHYALKANSTLAVLRVLRALGSAADANSGGEIEVALRAGFTPRDIVFTGVGKTDDELERAVALQVKTINAESAGEIERISAISSRLGRTARMALRVNPDVDARSHPHITTGLRINKFGVPVEDAGAICRAVARRAGIELVGLHVHVGSQVLSVDPFRHATRTILELAQELRGAGIALEHLDIGGGMGISYDGCPAPTAAEYAAAVLPLVRSSGLALILEPGRAIAGPAGALVSRVVDVKQAHGRSFIVLDAGMTELMRPALYGAFHRIEPVERRPDPPVSCDIVGPICETSDTFATGRPLPMPRVGDLVAVMDAGAYGVVMASNYNRRPRPAEVMVDDGVAMTVRRRQTLDEMLAGED